jgi:hypothetical protein
MPWAALAALPLVELRLDGNRLGGLPPGVGTLGATLLRLDLRSK